jgi:dTDP-4-dehydrorhamnose reductase
LPRIKPILLNIAVSLEPMTKTKVIVLGADGLLGSALMRTQTGYQVVGTSRRSQSPLYKYFHAQSSLVSLYGTHPDVKAVVVCMAQSSVSACNQDPSTSLEINLTNTLRLCHEASELGLHVVLFSSEYVFDGMYILPYNEQSPRNPKTLYGIQKKCLESLAGLFSGTVTILRISKLLSEEDQRSFYARMLRDLRTSRLYRASSEQVFTPIDLEIAANLVFRCIEERLFGLYNLCGSLHITRLELAKLMKAKYSLPCSITDCSLSDLELDYIIPPNLTMTSKKLQDLLGVDSSYLCPSALL